MLFILILIFLLIFLIIIILSLNMYLIRLFFIISFKILEFIILHNFLCLCQIFLLRCDLFNTSDFNRSSVEHGFGFSWRCQNLPHECTNNCFSFLKRFPRLRSFTRIILLVVIKSSFYSVKLIMSDEIFE